MEYLENHYYVGTTATVDRSVVEVFKDHHVSIRWVRRFILPYSLVCVRFPSNTFLESRKTSVCVNLSS